MTTGSWTFLTNHTHVLICLQRQPDIRVRDVAELVGITERAVLRIIGDLTEAGFLQIDKDGRRNHYTIISDKPLRHPVEADHSLAGILDALG